MVGRSGRRELLVSRGWVQAVAMVVLFGFFVLGLLAVVSLVVWHLHAAFRSSPANFPVPRVVHEENLRTGYRRGKEARR